MVDSDTLYTLDFVRSALPAGAKRLLEIGCGDGGVAALLAADSFEIVALDTDEAAVEAARARGVDARRAEWPHFEGSGFDAILFTRSLHHVHDLEAGVAAAFAALAPGGRIVVEDFAYEEADEASLAWLRDRAREIGSTSDFVEGLVSAEPPLTRWWRAHHDDHLHKAARMEQALRRSSATIEAADAAYYFRYPALSLAPDALAALLEEEQAAIAAGVIRPLGRRWIAAS